MLFEHARNGKILMNSRYNSLVVVVGTNRAQYAQYWNIFSNIRDAESVELFGVEFTRTRVQTFLRLPILNKYIQYVHSYVDANSECVCVFSFILTVRNVMSAQANIRGALHTCAYTKNKHKVRKLYM